MTKHDSGSAPVAARPNRAVHVSGLPSIPGLAVRRLDMGRDLGLLAELFVTANRHDGVEWMPTEAGLRNDYEHASGMDVDQDVLVAEVGGELVAAAETDWRLRDGRVFHQIDITVRPDHRRRGLGRALLHWMEDHVMRGVARGRRGPLDRGHLFTGWADQAIEGVEPFLTSEGFHIDGYGVTMVRSLAEPIAEAPLPEGLEVRPVRPEQHRQIWDADVQAFKDHRYPAVRTEEDYQGWFATPELDTSIWQVAWDGDEVAGSVMNFVWPDENEKLGLKRGWHEHISVRRPWRKQGLARALITASMKTFREMGLDEAARGSDAENLSGAVRLYESLGFRRKRTAAAYHKDLVLPRD